MTARRPPARSGSGGDLATTRSGRSLRVPAPAPRRLVGRGPVLADLRLVPARSLRNAAALRDRERGNDETRARIRILAVISVRHAPVVPGRGSGIFLHAQTGGPTIGCVSLRKDGCVQCCAGSDRAPRHSDRDRDEPTAALNSGQRLRGHALPLGSALFFAVAPCVVAGLVPWLLTRWEAGDTIAAAPDPRRDPDRRRRARAGGRVRPLPSSKMDAPAPVAPTRQLPWSAASTAMFATRCASPSVRRSSVGPPARSPGAAAVCGRVRRRRLRLRQKLRRADAVAAVRRTVRPVPPHTGLVGHDSALARVDLRRRHAGPPRATVAACRTRSSPSSRSACAPCGRRSRCALSATSSARIIIVHSMSIDIPDQLIRSCPPTRSASSASSSAFSARRGHASSTSPHSRSCRVSSTTVGSSGLDTPARATASRSSRCINAQPRRPLTRKLLRPAGRDQADPRPDRAAPAAAILLPFAASPDEVELAVRLGIPLYGADPTLESAQSTKSGSRGFRRGGCFARARPRRGGSATCSRHSASCGRRTPRSQPPSSSSTRASAARATRSSTSTPPSPRARWPARSSSRTRSSTPATTCRRSPTQADGGGADRGRGLPQPECPAPDQPVRTGQDTTRHNEILGGPPRADLLRLPLPGRYPVRAADRGRRAHRRPPAGEGVIGRAASTSSPSGARGRSESYALEINACAAGARHTVHGALDAHGRELRPARGRTEADWRPRALHHHDHLDSPAYASLTPDDLLDLVPQRHLGWDAEQETGIALHMVARSQ